MKINTASHFLFALFCLDIVFNIYVHTTKKKVT